MSGPDPDHRHVVQSSGGQAQLMAFRERASEARHEASLTSLPNVRDRWLSAAAAWDEMATRAERTNAARAEREKTPSA